MEQEEEEDNQEIQELGDSTSSLEQCVAANDKLQSYFENLLVRIEESLQDNLQHQEELEAAIAKARTSLYNRDKHKKLTLNKFHYPYVRDHAGNVPEPNEDVLKQQASGDINPMHLLSSSAWLTSEVTALKRGTRTLTLERMMGPAQKQRNKLNKERVNRKTPPERRVQLEREIAEIDDDFRKMKCTAVTVDPANIDWNRISQNFVPGRSPTECEMFWKNNILAGMHGNDWTEKEDDELLDLVPDRGQRDWHAIGKKMKIGRSAFQCLSRYEKLIAANLDNTSTWWSVEDSHRLAGAVDLFGAGRWRAVSDYLGNKRPHQCANRFRNMGGEIGLRKEAWTLEEDKALLQALNLYGALKWPSISRMVLGRTALQCRNRYTTCFQKPYEPEEDIELKTCVQGYSNASLTSWHRVAKNLKTGRTSTAVYARWRLLNEQEALQVEKKKAERQGAHKKLSDTMNTMRKLPGVKANMRMADTVTRLERGSHHSLRLLAKVLAETNVTVQEKSLELLERTRALDRQRRTARRLRAQGEAMATVAQASTRTQQQPPQPPPQQQQQGVANGKDDAPVAVPVVRKKVVMSMMPKEARSTVPTTVAMTTRTKAATRSTHAVSDKSVRRPRPVKRRRDDSDSPPASPVSRPKRVRRCNVRLKSYALDAEDEEGNAEDEEDNAEDGEDNAEDGEDMPSQEENAASTTEEEQGVCSASELEQNVANRNEREEKAGSGSERDESASEDEESASKVSESEEEQDDDDDDASVTSAADSESYVNRRVVAGEVIRPRFFTTSRQLAIAQRNLGGKSGVMSADLSEELKRRSAVAMKALATKKASALKTSSNARVASTTEAGLLSPKRIQSRNAKVVSHIMKPAASAAAGLGGSQVARLHLESLIAQASAAVRSAQNTVQASLEKALHKDIPLSEVSSLPRLATVLPPSRSTLQGLHRLHKGRTALHQPTTKHNLDETQAAVSKDLADSLASEHSASGRAVAGRVASSNPAVLMAANPATQPQQKPADHSDTKPELVSMEEVGKLLPQNNPEFVLLKRRFSALFLTSSLLRIIPLPGRFSMQPPAQPPAAAATRSCTRGASAAGGTHCSSVSAAASTGSPASASSDTAKSVAATACACVSVATRPSGTQAAQHSSGTQPAAEPASVVGDKRVGIADGQTDVSEEQAGVGQEEVGIATAQFLNASVLGLGSFMPDSAQ